MPPPPAAAPTYTGTQEAPIESYSVTYRGGLPGLPKPKVGKITLAVMSDRFALTPTTGSRKYWDPLEIPYSSITSVVVTDRTLNTFEGIVGGLDSRQLNQKNNIHIEYHGPDGLTRLRLEMLSGVSVMGQAKKCNEFEDRLRIHRIRERFAAATTAAPITEPTQPSLSEELERLASMKAAGHLTDDEFAAAKARVLGT